MDYVAEEMASIAAAGEEEGDIPSLGDGCLELVVNELLRLIVAHGVAFGDVLQMTLVPGDAVQGLLAEGASSAMSAQSFCVSLMARPRSRPGLVPLPCTYSLPHARSDRRKHFAQVTPRSD